MKVTRDIRRLAFQALFQFDVRGEGAEEDIERAVRENTPGEVDDESMRAAMELARGAWADRRSADEAVRDLAPTWPAHRQPAADRAILRLAHHEMSAGLTPPKVVVNEAIELAKAFSTDRSPSFVNGVLDKIMKRRLAALDEERGAEGPAIVQEVEFKPAPDDTSR